MNIVVDAIDFVLSHPGQVLGDVRGHVVLSAAAVAVAVAIAIPVGAVVGHLHRGSFLAINGANVLRALPTLAIISIGIPVFGLGFGNILVALIILGFPLILTNTYVGVAEVDPGMAEAARGMGMTGWQILTRVELPNAVPLIMAGVRTATVFIIATAYLAGIAGYPDTLGAVITNPTLPLFQLFAYTVIAVVLAFLADGVFAVLQRLLTPRGLRLTPAPAAA
ncbi:MAG: ABC transporter permease [Pseudonocardiaceae bacterium]